ncbi:MAG TPA: hypothetical protein VJB14_13975 [Planctomycetota bacterium]|nr:hypothetical protein [Planctomycetota bacterium]
MFKPALIGALALAAFQPQAQDPADAARQRQARVNDLRKQAGASDEGARLRAIQELGTIFSEDARSVLVAKTTSDSEAVRLAAGKALILHKKPLCAQALGNAVQANAKSDKLVKGFIGLLAELDMCASIAVLLHVVESRPASGNDALEALVKIGCPESATALVNYLKKAETEEKKPDFFDNIPVNGQPRRPGTPDKIENKTKDKAVAALAPKVREALKALTGRSFDTQREWAAALQSGSLTPRLASIYLCESTREKFDMAAGKSKKCPNGGDAKSDHEDAFLKHRRE